MKMMNSRRSGVCATTMKRTALTIAAAFFACCLLHSVVSSYNIIIPTTHKIFKSRRKFIISTTASILSPLVVPLTDQIACAAEEHCMNTTKEIAQFIKKHTNQNFLRSVVESEYNFLYRGLSPNANKQLVTESKSALVITDEPFDLLEVETYGSDAAATYFQSLEVQMNANRLSIRPSNSHIGSTCPLEAAKWGTAVSIWPLGEQGVQFAWLENGGLFWPVTSSRSRTVSHSDGSGLSEALRGDAWEIMFRADNGFLAVPAALDDELKQILRQ
jgi:hypothetical protein